MGFPLFIRSRIYSLPSTSGTPEGQLEQPQASGTREALWNGPPLTMGVRGVLCFSSILMGRVRLCLRRVVRLLERAEEGCEGLKHGCYDLPCVYFLIFLCHDIKNKIDMLVFIFMNKIKQNYQNYFSLSNKKSCLILRIELCSLFMFRTPQASGLLFSATGTSHSGCSCTCVRW